MGKFFKNLAKGAERVELGTPRQQTSVPNLAVLPFPKTARFSGNLAHETTLASETVPSWHSGPESSPKPTPFLRRGPESGICISIPIPGHFGVGIGVGNRTVLTLNRADAPGWPHSLVIAPALHATQRARAPAGRPSAATGIRRAARATAIYSRLAARRPSWR